MANELARAAEDRLASTLERYDQHTGPAPALQLVLDAARARRLASQRLEDALHLLTRP